MMWKKSGAALAGVLLLAAGPATAQIATRLVATEQGRVSAPLCPLRVSGRTTDGQRAFRTGIEDRDAVRRATALTQARDILEAHVQAGGILDAGAWYYLARTYLAQGDVPGADSAFTRAEELLPACEFDINSYRQNAWATLANAGIDKMREGDNDSALVLLKQAHGIFRDLPDVSERIGVLLAYADQYDSAVVYFTHALEVSEADTALVDNRNSAALNLANTLLRAERFADASNVLRRYLSWEPDDMDSRRTLAYTLRQAGMMEAADSLEAVLAEEFAQMNFDELSSPDLMSVGVSFFHANEFARARDVFRILMARNWWSRDAVFNLANTHLALEEWDQLVEVGKHLLEIEPLNEDAYRLVGQGYRELGRQDDLIRTAEGLVTLPLSLEVTGVSLSETGARFTAVAHGRLILDRAGQEQAPVPVTVVIEFLDQGGTVVASREVDVPALLPDQQHEVRAEATASGISAWRYRLKG
jgi:tetratricopeptide (TPR) repeat protein